MTAFTLHTTDTAPDGSREVLEASQKALGFVPNLYARMAGSPAALEGYTTLAKIFDTSSLSPTERQVVLITASFENGCDYCMAAQSTIAGMQKVSDEVVAALREGAPIGDTKLDALANLTRSVVRERGWASESDLQAFLEAGYGEAQVHEVVLGVGLKVLSNYTNHLASLPLDEAFKAQAWTRPVAV